MGSLTPRTFLASLNPSRWGRSSQSVSDRPLVTRVSINRSFLPHLGVGSALLRGTSTTLISGNFVAPLLLFSVVPHCALLPRRSCWSLERGLACYSTAPRLLCGWSDGLEWSAGCAASDASGPLCSIPLWPQHHIVWPRLGWERSWVDYIEGALYETAVIRIRINFR